MTIYKLTVRERGGYVVQYFTTEADAHTSVENSYPRLRIIPACLQY